MVLDQLMVRLVPSTTVTLPTGSMVTVWATETLNKAKRICDENQRPGEHGVLAERSVQTCSQR